MPTGAPKLSQQLTDEEDGIIWNASLVLLNHFRRKMPNVFRGKRVLEFGSGLGHVARGLCELGAHVTATDMPCSDLEASRRRAEAFMAEKAGDETCGTLRIVELTWGKDHWEKSPLSKEDAKYDFVILAEVFSIPDVHEELVWTLTKFMHADATVWSIYMNRPFSMMVFVHISDAGGFRVEQMDTDDIDFLGLDTSEIICLMHRITYVPSSPRIAAS